jgi:methylene-tetrahydromethanopterin dehydrogenase
MKDPYLLHMFNPTKNVSPFDVNMAYEADFDGVIPYADVSLQDIHGLTQDTIFSRGPTGVRRTGIFIGGRDFALAEDMLAAAREAMVPPFEVSVFADPSGAFTTAAALMACVEAAVKKQGQGTLEGKNVQIYGGTGPVGICAGVISARCGAQVSLVSHRGADYARSEATVPYNARYEVEMIPANGRTGAAIERLLPEAHVVIGAAKAGVQVLSGKQLARAKQLLVAADVNAVPPLGIEGVGVHDNGKVLDGTPSKALGIGALAVGDVKYKVHYRLFQMMINADKALYLSFPEAFEVAREHAG